MRQPKSKTRFVRVDDTFVDKTYQRDLREKNPVLAAPQLDIDALGIPVVSDRGVLGYAILDGQHRIERLKRDGFGASKIEVEIYAEAALTVADEARIYHALNFDRVRPHKLNDFAASLAAGDERDNAIADELARFGLAMRGCGGGIMAVAELRKLYDLGGRDLVCRSIGVLVQFGTPKAFQAALVGGVGILLAKRGDVIDDARLARVLVKSGTPDRLVGQARTMADAGGQKMAMAYVISHAYNKSRGASIAPLR